ncbi:predicted protein [Chaetoceros tenuissimus]|uniref:Uncharacterized protein n=1 Tax=Chaetoceros tenuissimus TaxID=426638 RepID=A0AAD3CF56_9STRA|nr:predicted protein [Chaetoceros tenuissimus]
MQRRRHFPLQRLIKSWSTSIQDTIASNDSDRKHILNAIVGQKDEDMEYLICDHEKYKDFNDIVQKALSRFLNGPPITPLSLNQLKSIQTLSRLSIAHCMDLDEQSRIDLMCLFKLSKADILSICYEDDFEDKQKQQQLLCIQQEQGMHIGFMNFGQHDTVRMFHENSLPTGSLCLGIITYPYGREVMDSVLDWLENTSPPNLGMAGTCIGWEIGGKECGERLARFLAREDCNINMLLLSDTDLIGSRNVGTWIECVKRSCS